jgi:hypothetical protein
MKTHLKSTIYIGIIWVLAALILCGHASAASSVDVDPSPEPTWITVPTSSVQVSGEEIPGTYPIYRINQGDTVYLGDHVDISGALAGNPDIAYFKGEDYQDYGVSPVILPLPNQKSGWYDYYISPEVFSKYPGTWHKWNGYYEFHANTVAFKVIALYRNTTMTYQNGTVVNTSELVSGEHNVSINPTPTEILPTKHIADYVIPRYGSLNITVPDKSAVWIFDGTDNSIVYSESVFTENGSEIRLSDSAIYSLPPSRYKILIQTVGDISPYLDVKYEGANIVKWFDRSTFQVHTVDFNGMTPDVAIATLEHILQQTTNTYSEQYLEIQEPSITITRMDKVSTSFSKDYYRLDTSKGNVSLMEVRGYTNAPNGTNISVILDLDHTTARDVKYSTFKTVAVGSSLGDLRCYKVFVPLYENSLYVGLHSLTASTEIGGSMKGEFPVTVMPTDSFQDSVTVKWVGDENPWKPNMTIAEPIVEVVTVVQTQVVIEKRDPTPDEIKSAQGEILKESVSLYGTYFVVVAVVAAIGYLVVRFVYRARKRKMWEKR